MDADAQGSLLPAEGLTAQQLTGLFVDLAVARNGTRPPRRVTARIAREAKVLLKEGVSSGDLLDGIKIVVERGLEPSLLSSAVFTAQSQRGKLSRDDRRILNRHVNEHGWPTGARYVRGESSGQYVYDPLGHDDLPSGYRGWPHDRPGASEIVAALKDD